MRELRAALLKTVPENMQGKVLQSALAAGARPVVQRAKALAPAKSGTLRRAIHSRRDKRNSNGVFEQRVVTVYRGKGQQEKGSGGRRKEGTGRDAWYWRFVEFGRPEVEVKHRKGRRGAMRSVLSDGTTVFGSSVKAAPAQPFLRPAFTQTHDAQLTGIRTGLSKALDKAVARAKWTR